MLLKTFFKSRSFLKNLKAIKIRPPYISAKLVIKTITSKYDIYHHCKNFLRSIRWRMFRSGTDVRQRNKSRRHKRSTRIFTNNVPEYRNIDNVYTWSILRVLPNFIQCYLASVVDIPALVESTRIACISS